MGNAGEKYFSVDFSLLIRSRHSESLATKTYPSLSMAAGAHPSHSPHGIIAYAWNMSSLHDGKVLYYVEDDACFS